MSTKNKLKSMGRKVRARIPFGKGETRRKIRKLSQEAQTRIAAKSLDASSAAARTAMKGPATRVIQRALGERDPDRLGKMLKKDTRLQRRYTRATSKRGRLGFAVERVGTGGTDPGPLPSDAAPWDRLHVWLVAGEGLPLRPNGWLFEPYVVVTADVDDALSKQEKESDGSPDRLRHGPAPRAVSAYEFRVRAPYMDCRRPVWDEKGYLCYRRGDAGQFRVLLGAQSRLTGALYLADVLNPFGLLRSLWRTLARIPQPPPSQAVFELPTAGGPWELRRVPLRGGGELTLK
eukprot:512458-Prymnesium_polylepis.1